MPREKTQFKFRYKEIFGGNYDCCDKWVEHCRKKHSSKVLGHCCFAVNLIKEWDWLMAGNSQFIIYFLVQTELAGRI